MLPLRLGVGLGREERGGWDCGRAFLGPRLFPAAPMCSAKSSPPTPCKQQPGQAWSSRPPLRAQAESPPQLLLPLSLWPPPLPESGPCPFPPLLWGQGLCPLPQLFLRGCPCLVTPTFQPCRAHKGFLPPGRSLPPPLAPAASPAIQRLALCSSLLGNLPQPQAQFSSFNLPCNPIRPFPGHTLHFQTASPWRGAGPGWPQLFPRLEHCPPPFLGPSAIPPPLSPMPRKPQGNPGLSQS